MPLDCVKAALIDYSGVMANTPSYHTAARIEAFRTFEYDD